MTSHSGDSFVGEAPEEPPSTPMRCHTALGICSSSSSLSPDHLSGESMESLDNSELSTSTPRKVTSPNGIRKHNTDSSSTDQEVVDLAVMDENYNPLNDFEPVPEGQLLDAEGHDRNGKSKNLSGFLKKFRSNKRKRAAKGTNTL